MDPSPSLVKRNRSLRARKPAPGVLRLKESGMLLGAQKALVGRTRRKPRTSSCVWLDRKPQVWPPYGFSASLVENLVVALLVLVTLNVTVSFLTL
jgi:hypothetical protein